MSAGDVPGVNTDCHSSVMKAIFCLVTIPSDSLELEVFRMLVVQENQHVHPYTSFAQLPGSQVYTQGGP